MMKVSFIGAGNVARSLGSLVKNGGHDVLFSSSDPKEGVVPVKEAIEEGEVICFAIPFGAVKMVVNKHKEALRGKVIVDITNTINSTDWSPLLLGEESSGAEELAKLAEGPVVVKAFNTIFADVMRLEKQEFDGQKLTVFIASDDKNAAAKIGDLAKDAGFIYVQR